MAYVHQIPIGQIHGVINGCQRYMCEMFFPIVTKCASLVRASRTKALVSPKYLHFLKFLDIFACYECIVTHEWDNKQIMLQFQLPCTYCLFCLVINVLIDCIRPKRPAKMCPLRNFSHCPRLRCGSKWARTKQLRVFCLT